MIMLMEYKKEDQFHESSLTASGLMLYMSNFTLYICFQILQRRIVVYMYVLKQRNNICIIYGLNLLLFYSVAISTCNNITVCTIKFSHFFYAKIIR